MPIERKLSAVIADRCVAVTSSAAVMFGTAATMASRTTGVRSLTASVVDTKVVSATSITLMMTVIASVRLPSETVIIKV